MNGRAACKARAAWWGGWRREGRWSGLWVVVIAVACADSGGRAGPDPFAALPVERRGAAVPFDLERLDGGRLRLADYRGRLALVNIWASWCGPCRQEMPALARLAGELGDSAVALVTLSDDVERDRAAAFVAELGFPYPVGLGLGRLRGRHYGFGLPFTMLVDAEGRVMYRWYGFGGVPQLEAIRRMVTDERRRGAAAGQHDGGRG